MFEAHALRPVDPKVDEEEWPLFELKDATVSHFHRREHIGQPVDLFEVNLHGPFRIKGKLGKLKKDQESLALSTRLYNEEITIARVYTYSLEIKDDGKLIIWALGGAGWYALSPSKEYKTIFQQMIEKAKIWFFLEDRYTPEIFKGKQKKLKDTMELLYKEFARENPEWPDIPAASELFHKYHQWIILKMLVKEDQTKNWARTPIHAEMFEKYPNVVVEFQRILKRRSAATAAVSDGEIFSQLTADDSQATIAVKPATPPAQADSVQIANPIAITRTVRPNSKSYILLSILEKHLNADAVEPQYMTLPRLVSYTFQKIEFKDKEMAADVLQSRAPDLLILMPQSTTYPWMETRVIKDFNSSRPPPKRYTAAIAHKIVERLGDDRGDIVPGDALDARSIPDTMDEDVSAEEDNADEGNDSESEDEIMESKSSKGKSVLRPRASEIPLEASEPPSPLFGKMQAIQDVQDEDMPDFDINDEIDASSATASKRGAEETNVAERLTKRMRSLQAQSSPSVQDAKIEWPPLRPGTGKPPIKIGKMPPTTSNRPGGLWICSLPGCNHKVYKSETPEGILQIEQHYESHSLKMKDAMDTVARETENARGIYPVDHLLAKIEEMAKRWAERRPTK